MANANAIDRELPTETPTPAAHPDRSATQRPDGRMNAAISDAVVRLFREYLGRGPTKTRTTIRDDLVVVLLEDTLTKAEKKLAADGEEEAVVQMRRAAQGTMRTALADAVAEHTGRQVRAFMSGNSLDPDYAVEVFVLEPGNRDATASWVERA